LIADPAFRKYVDNSVQFEPLDVQKSRNNPFFLWKIYQTIQRFDPDIIHVHKQNTIEIIKKLKPFLRAPFVVTKQDMQTKKAFFGLKYAVAISEETKRTVRADKIYKIYNGVPYQEPQKIEMPPVFNIVAVGGLREVKGYSEERASLEALIKRLDLTAHVTLAGFSSRINDYLYSADLQVISSHSEGFSLAMIEGIFYTPVLISTKVSGCTEILPQTLLMDRHEILEKIEDVYHHYNRYKEYMRLVKSEYKDQLTMEHCASQYVNVYQDIIDLDSTLNKGNIRD